jgi:hypothetical protein
MSAPSSIRAGPTAQQHQNLQHYSQSQERYSKAEMKVDNARDALHVFTMHMADTAYRATLHDAVRGIEFIDRHIQVCTLRVAHLKELLEQVIRLQRIVFIFFVFCFISVLFINLFPI